MRKTGDRMIFRLIAKAGAGLLAAVFVVIFCLAGMVKAEEEIVISATPRKTDLGPGDLLIVDVVASSMPAVTRFGPVQFSFDADKAEYVTLEQGKELGSFVFTETQKDGVYSVTGMDVNAGAGAQADNDDGPTASLYSDDPVILFSVFLRILPDNKGDINCWINDPGEFVSYDKKIISRIGNSVNLPVRRTGISSDATIASLKIRGASITPDFNPNITEYSCSVERSVTDAQISTISSNLWAAVVIDGSQHLVMGDNTVRIDVTAQDGVNRMRYTIHILRRESNVPDNASLVDLNGNTYTFLDSPEDAKIPEGFTQTTKNINGYSVPAYVKEGVTSILLYLFDGTQSPGFYFYNSNTKTVRRYEPENTIIEMSSILRIVPVPSDVIIPDEFKPAEYDTGTRILSGYENADGDFICYLSDDSGRADFYYFDKQDGTISRYRFADKKAELLYSYLFDVFLVIAIIEAVIITITVYIVRRMVSGRTNPRPKRV